MENNTNFENWEILNGPFRLFFMEECGDPKTAPIDKIPGFLLPLHLYAPHVRFYLDPNGLDSNKIICSSLVRRATVRDCQLYFPLISSGKNKEAREKREWRFFKCSEYKEIFKKPWKR